MSGGSINCPYALAGFHEQATLNANCQRIASSSSSFILDYIMNHHDPPIYDMNLALQLLQSCLRDDEFEFWAATEHRHQFKVKLTTVECLRTGSICHIFNGDCVLHRGAECKGVFTSDACTHAMGIRVIYSTVQWVQQGVLAADELSHICDALDIETRAKRRPRSLLAKLTERRRDLPGDGQYL